MNLHKENVQRFILHNKLLELHPIEAVQVRNGSFDLTVTKEACPANGYKKKESLTFFEPSDLERFEATRLIDVSFKRPLELSDLIH